MEVEACQVCYKASHIINIRYINNNRKYTYLKLIIDSLKACQAQLRFVRSRLFGERRGPNTTNKT